MPAPFLFVWHLSHLIPTKSSLTKGVGSLPPFPELVLGEHSQTVLAPVLQVAVSLWALRWTVRSFIKSFPVAAPPALQPSCTVDFDGAQAPLQADSFFDDFPPFFVFFVADFFLFGLRCI